MPRAAAQESDSAAVESSSAEEKKYSPAVVAKAQAILKEVGLRQSGKTIQATETSSISRAIAGLSREKRELRLLGQDWKKGAEQLAAIQQELRKLNTQDIELNLQLARVAPSDVRTNNRLVGLLNAARARAKLLVADRDQLKEQLGEKRASVNESETQYAETVMAIRKEFTSLRSKLAAALTDEKVEIALRVMHRNHETPPAPSADTILLALNKRIERIEQEIFSETIGLEVEGGSLYVDVVVGKKSLRMVVDSGASMITLPARQATELGIKVPPDARRIRMILADGSTIEARGVTLPRVRIGEFEATEVEAAVLNDASVMAEPLLGMSYLGNLQIRDRQQPENVAASCA